MANTERKRIDLRDRTELDKSVKDRQEAYRAKIEMEESEGIYRNEIGQRIGKREYESMKNPPMPFARGTQSEDGKYTPVSTLENVKNLGRAAVNMVPRGVAGVMDAGEKAVSSMGRRISGARTAEDEKRARNRKSDNVPAQITEEDRQKGRDEIARTKREMTSDSDIPASDKESMSKMIESEEGFKRGGSVRKYAMGGLVRGSVRGGGVALRGLGKGKVY
jgi:hypothetical protein